MDIRVARGLDLFCIAFECCWLGHLLAKLKQQKQASMHDKNHSRKNKKKTEIVCRCNNISRQTIEDAIVNGCDTMNKIFDSTTAGVGPCGGTCRRKIVPLLEHYLTSGDFPEKLVEDQTGKNKKS